MAIEQDQIAAPFPVFDRNVSEPLVYLEQYYAYILHEAELAAQWYFHKRCIKKRIGSGLRYFALLMTTLAGVLPLISSILYAQAGPFTLERRIVK
jgi:hypothetical protein